MMNRLTERNESPCTHCTGIGKCRVDCENKKIYDKLQRYEDLEESGRLIELPCAVDEFVWVAKNGENTRRVLLDSASDILWEIEHGYTIGYTREEAEAALKEREQNEKKLYCKQG